jgi:hypothetical protein
MLLQAASGLEALMPGIKAQDIKDSTISQISAILYYKANVVAKLNTSKSFKENFRKIVYTQIEKDFGAYIDAQARSKPLSFHHVYEWKKVGDSKARLFKLKQLESTGLSFKIDFMFLQSKSAVPSKSKRKYVFREKARVMELGNPVIISPKNAKRIVFEGSAGTVFMPIGKSVTVKRPGGSKTKNSFTLQYSRWFSGQLVNESIKKSGFFQAFQGSMKKALTVPGSLKQFKYSFSPASVRNEADASFERHFGGAML